ncbi:MAG: GNAT family N-acetyltransferase [Microgenomates group bacterium]
MNLRFARPNDVQILQNLNNEIFVDNSKYDPDIIIDWAQSPLGRDYFTQVVNDSDSICLIAEENGKPIGYINAAPKEFDYRHKKYIEVQNMGVSPDFRSKGVGAELMKECLKIAKEKGFEAVYVVSYYDNSKAVAFYEKSGFKRIDLGLERDL